MQNLTLILYLHDLKENNLFLHLIKVLKLFIRKMNVNTNKYTLELILEITNINMGLRIMYPYSTQLN